MYSEICRLAMVYLITHCIVGTKENSQKCGAKVKGTKTHQIYESVHKKILLSPDNPQKIVPTITPAQPPSTPTLIKELKLKVKLKTVNKVAA